MDACTIIAGAFLLFLIFRFLSKRCRTTEGNHSPPEAGGAWPIIGHLHLLRGNNQLVHRTLGSLADRYGPIFTIRLGVREAMVVSSSEVAKEIFTMHDLVVSSRPQVVALKHLGFNYAMFGFSPYGPYWRELRKITSLELLSKTRLEQLKHVRISEIETSIKELYNKWNEKKDGLSGSVLVEMKKWFGDLTLNLVLRIFVGKRYFGDNINGDDEKVARLCQKVLRDFSYLMGQLAVPDLVPWLGWVDIGGCEKAMKMAGQEMDSLFEGWLQEHRRRKTTTDEAGRGQDFMDILLSVVDGADFDGRNPDAIVKATCMALISGGSDTTTITMIWTLSLLLNNRDALRKVVEELDMHVGKDRRVDEEDIVKLPYLQAVVKESFRLYPPGPLASAREFREDCVISGYQVPKGTWLIVNVWKLQRDSYVWKNPLEFRPERFLTTHKDTDIKGHHFEILPFGAGRRICPGITFGLQMIHLVLANLLQAFEISTRFDEPVDMTESAGITNIKATPLDVLITPRLSSSLY